MKSKTALDYLKKMEAKGLSPTPEDVITLNAFGLRLEAAKGARVYDSTYLLPRVAAVSETLAFRQPTLGHEIWLAKVDRWIKSGDFQTFLVVNCFALSRPWDQLPDPDLPSVIREAVEPWLETVKGYTVEQLFAAVRYAKYGADETAGETVPGTDAGKDDGETFDFDECVAVGVLNEGRVVLSGQTAADLKSMTKTELDAVIRSAYAYQRRDMGSEADRLETMFFRAVDAIEERLKRNG